MPIISSRITLSKTEYERLRRKAERYELLRNAITEDFFEEPPIQNPDEIINEMEATGHYTKAFLKSFHRGLKESSLSSKQRV
jgi:hypothetical protein